MARHSGMRTFLGHLATLGEAMCVGLAVPVVILAAGVPIVLTVRLVLAVAMWLGGHPAPPA
jgi:hypothetical protein